MVRVGERMRMLWVWERGEEAWPSSWASVQPDQPVPRITRVGLLFGECIGEVVGGWDLLRVVGVMVGDAVWMNRMEFLL